MSALLVTSNVLAPDDNDLSTLRVCRDPRHPSGTGRRAPIVRVEWIKVPNDPLYVEAGGEKFSRLGWCDECKSYQFAATHPCTFKPRECADDYY